MTSMALKLVAAVQVPLKPLGEEPVSATDKLVVYADMSRVSVPDPAVMAPLSAAPLAKTKTSLPLLPYGSAVVLTRTLKVSTPEPPCRLLNPEKVRVPGPEA